MKEAEKEIAREYYKELIARENVTLALVSSIVCNHTCIFIDFFLNARWQDSNNVVCITGNNYWFLCEVWWG